MMRTGLWADPVCIHLTGVSRGKITSIFLEDSLTSFWQHYCPPLWRTSHHTKQSFPPPHPLSPTNLSYFCLYRPFHPYRRLIHRLIYLFEHISFTYCSCFYLYHQKAMLLSLYLTKTLVQLTLPFQYLHGPSFSPQENLANPTILGSYCNIFSTHTYQQSASPTEHFHSPPPNSLVPLILYYSSISTTLTR